MLRTPAPFIGALGLSLKRAFALLSGLTRALLVPASMAALKSRIALPRVLSGPDKNVALCHSFFPRALASDVRSQGVCVGFAQWLNQSFADAPVGRCAKPAIDTRST